MKYVGQADRVPLGKYIATLLAVQTAFGLILGLIAALGPKPPAAFGILGSIAGIYLAATWFVDDYTRPMERPERKRFAFWGTFFAFAQLALLFFVSIITELGFLAPLALIVEIPRAAAANSGWTTAIIFGAALTVLLTYAIYYIFAGKYSELIAKRRSTLPPTLS